MALHMQAAGVGNAAAVANAVGCGQRLQGESLFGHTLPVLFGMGRDASCMVAPRWAWANENAGRKAPRKGQAGCATALARRWVSETSTMNNVTPAVISVS
ncbi:hypothetical protein D3C75_1234350 [compost metagenome]